MRRPWLVPGAVLGLAVALGAGLFAVRELGGEPVGRFPLPDGSRLVIESVTFGDREYVRAPWWRRALREVLPATLKDRIPVATDRGNSPITLHWRTDAASGTEGPATSQLSLVAVVADEAGNRAMATYSPFLMGDDEGLSERKTLGFEAYPRRARALRCRVYAQSRGNWPEVAALSFLNPEPGPYPHWQAPALPQTRRDGRVAVTLRELKAIAPPAGQEIFGHFPGIWTRAVFHVTQDGRPTALWMPQTVTVRDATGNCFSGAQAACAVRGGLVSVDFETSSGPMEDVWKLEFDFEKAREYVREPVDLWTLRDIRLPRPGRTRRVARKRLVNGLGVEVAGVYGHGGLPEAFTWDSGNPSSSPELMVRFTRPRDLRDGEWPVAEVEFSNQRGWVDAAPMMRYFGDETGGTLLYRIRAPRGTTAVDARIIVRRRVRVEFTATRRELEQEKRRKWGS